jgi:homogentisate 1,2-dioxygenase
LDEPVNGAAIAASRGHKDARIMRSWIHHAKGRFVRQARVGLGDLREELIGRQGFFGPVATVYREHGPNEIVRVEGTLYPRRAADTGRVEASDGRDARGSPEVLLSNADVSVAVSRRSAAMPFAYRNVDGDLLYFVHKGSGQFVTEFGRLVYEPGDYVLIPKGITFSVWPDAGDSHMLVVESAAPLSLTEHQQVGRHMPVDPTVLVLPELHDQAWPRREEWELRVKHGGAYSSIFYRNNPLVSVGWKGDLFPFKLNIRDIIPISSDRIHVAPSAWCTFEAAGFVVITFVPQMAVADLNAEELPSYHRNVDNDESVFVHHDASGRAHPGMLSYTPQGILHGADEATRAAFQAKRTPGMRRTLCGVSVDTDRPLVVSAAFDRLAVL